MGSLSSGRTYMQKFCLNLTLGHTRHNSTQAKCHNQHTDHTCGSKTGIVSHILALHQLYGQIPQTLVSSGHCCDCCTHRCMH